MSLSHPSIEWLVLDEQDDEPSSLHRLDEVSYPAHKLYLQEQLPRKSSRLYELILGIALFYGIAVFWVWQRAEQQVAMLTDEVFELRKEVEKSKQEAMDPLEEDRSDALAFETDYLRFETSKRTAKYVKEILQSSNAMYRIWHQNLGVTLPASNEKLIIYVDGVESNKHQGEMVLNVPFPDKVIQQYKLAEADAIRSSISVALSEYVLGRALGNRDIRPQWDTMVTALQLYNRLENSHLADWSTSALYLSNRRLAIGKSLDSVLWQNSLLEDGIYPFQDANPGGVADPLVEFIIEIYGVGRIGPILDGFEFHDSWTTLAPEVFGITASQLEKDWHEYLENRYWAPTLRPKEHK